MTSRSFTLLCRICAIACLLALPVEPASGGTLNIIERQSDGVNSLFAGSGGATDTRDMAHTSAALTGTFDFDDSGTVDVLDSDQFSTGTASATGIASVSDSVSQPNAATIVITASATGESTALVVSGPSNANSRQRARTRVRFQVIGSDATYQLTGTFTPPVDTGEFIGDAVSLELRRPFTPNKKFDINTAGPVNESGVLSAGQTWELIVHINDKSAASAMSTSDSDLFSYNLTFTVSNVPEPGACGIFAVAALTFLAGSRGTRRHR